MERTGLERVTARYEGGPVVLDDVTLLADPGELFVVVGPSGSGKSTLLRVMAGMTRVEAGEVLIGGQRVTGQPAQQRDVAMVFEYNRLLPFLTVADNMGFGLTVRHTPKDEITHRVEEQARGLRLTRLLGRKPATLSAGENGQAAIGRALVRKPSANWALPPSTSRMTSRKPLPSRTGSRCCAPVRSPRSGRPMSSTRGRPTCLWPISSAAPPSACFRPRWSSPAGTLVSRWEHARCRYGGRLRLDCSNASVAMSCSGFVRKM